MAWAGNNPTVFNAALAAYIAAAKLSAGPLPVASGSLTSLEAQATAFATEVDSVIVTDATLSAAGPPTSTIAPSAGINAASAYVKGHLIFGLCFNALQTGFLPSSSAPTFATIAAAVLAIYTAAVAAIAAAGSET
jgi:hypothetical protein